MEDELNRLFAAQAATQRRGQDDDDTQTDILENVYSSPEQTSTRESRDAGRDRSPARAQSLSGLRGLLQQYTRRYGPGPSSVQQRRHESIGRASSVRQTQSTWDERSEDRSASVRPSQNGWDERSRRSSTHPLNASGATSPTSSGSPLRAATTIQREDSVPARDRRESDPYERHAQITEDKELAEAIQKSLLDAGNQQLQQREQQELEDAKRKSLLETSSPSISRDETADERYHREMRTALRASLDITPATSTPLMPTYPPPPPPTDNEPRQATDCSRCTYTSGLPYSIRNESRLTLRCGQCNRRYHLSCLQEDLKQDMTEVVCLTRGCGRRFTYNEVRSIIGFRWDKYCDHEGDRWR